MVEKNIRETAEWKDLRKKFNYVEFITKGITESIPRAKILWILKQAKEPLSMMNIQKSLKMGWGTTKHHIKVLKEQGLIKVEKSKHKKHNPLMITLK